MQNASVIGTLILLCLSARLHAETVIVKFVVSTRQPVAEEDTLYLAGNTETLGNWKPSGLALNRKTATSFEKDVQLQLGETTEFKITRGTWETVEKNADGNEISNRIEVVKKETEIVVIVESWADERPRRSPSTVVGTLEILHIASMEPPRTVRVWLPPGYRDSTLSYPVLYMLDGQNVFDRATSAIGEEWGVDETLTQLIHEESVPPMIVVAIDNSTQRIDEYTFLVDDDGKQKRGGKASVLAKWIVGELKPQIDREYRTQSPRATTWIAGSSLGGLFSLFSVVQHHETFGGAIAMSPSLAWGNEGMSDWMDSSQNLIKQPTRVWLDFGGKEGTTEQSSQANAKRFERFEAMLDSIAQKHNANIKIGGGLFPDAKHQESDWRERFPDAIKFLTQ
jgi:predicted alpha/beta superfamily hydrolase